jgi:hypothetical protein
MTEYLRHFVSTYIMQDVVLARVRKLLYTQKLDALSYFLCYFHLSIFISIKQFHVMNEKIFLPDRIDTFHYTVKSMFHSCLSTVKDVDLLI